MLDDHDLRRAWCELDASALRHNVRALRARLSGGACLAVTVKGNAYGHGLLPASRLCLEAGADWLCVDSLHEAVALRQAGVTAPVYIVGHVPAAHAEALVEVDARVILYDHDVAEAFAAAAVARGRRVPVHVKLETGNQRQGLPPDEALALIRHIEQLEGLWLEGVSTHFANVEDTIDHSFAREQLDIFNAFLSRLAGEGVEVPRPNIANSAATLLWPETHHGLVRVGIAAYGMWPSRETLLSTMLAGRAPLTLRPALRWLTRVAQLKDVPPSASIGYGATFRTTHRTRLAVLPVGYYDGYDRGLSNLAHVLIRGHRAPLRGRVCMNMIMVDVTHVPGVQPGDEVILLGADGDEAITAEELAGWMGTINYEVTTRIHEAIPRRVVEARSSR